ncbi:hypothetical protein PT190_03405 [Erysipelothrix rhusiopathiae]|nr:hypothetical protein [Erysipelothrix rhusiopathiae]
MNKAFKFLSLSFLSVFLLFALVLPASANYSESFNSEDVEIKFDDSGEVVSFFVPIEENNHLSDEIMNDLLIGDSIVADSVLTRSAAEGIYKFVQGTCIVVELLSGYSCVQVAREIGLALYNGKYMSNGKPYTGKWQVTYGYKPGCQPQHSGVCFGATYKKIG